jgi:signal transduction histidine kinase
MSERVLTTDSDLLSIERGVLLFIDDEEEILKALRRQFRRDYEVFTARSAEEGYRILLENPVQVVISDQRMPGMNGSEFFGKVKNEFPDVIRLLLTGYADVQAVIAAINEGNIFRYVMKPWDPVELSTIVREAFSRYALVMQNRRLFSELQAANEVLEQRIIERTQMLERVNLKLQDLIEQKDSFIGMMAHDLRTPIQVIQGFTDLLVNPNITKQDFQEFVQVIRQTMRDMLNLINNLLDITAIESGKVVLSYHDIDVYEFIGRLAKLNGVIGAQKGIRLEVSVENDLPPWSFDRPRIEQVVNNLLSNAFKFSRPGTRVQVRVRRCAEGLEISVIDEGMGIRSDEIDRIFTEFQKISNKPTGNESSTGLGLSICKRLVELHQGCIGVESEYGKGSRFYFTLPHRKLLGAAAAD